MHPAGKCTGRRRLLDLVVDGAIEPGAGGEMSAPHGVPVTRHDPEAIELGAGVLQLLDLVVDEGR